MEKPQTERAIVEKKFGKKTLVVGGIIALFVIAAIAVIAVGLTGSWKKELPCAKIETPYIDLVLPLELESFITNDEATYGTVYTRAFYMNYGGKVLPLWRIDFGDANAGDWIGMLKTDQGDIPVVSTGFTISDEDLAALAEEGAELYGQCMQGYAVMLDGIMADPRFTSERPLAVGEDTKLSMTYWDVALPDTMVVQENSNGGNYEATFFGEVVGEAVPLYRVRIGEEQAKSFLGYFEVGGAKMPVSVESLEISERDSWSEDDYAAAYRMMDTINDVIEAIMQSKQFSVEAE